MYLKTIEMMGFKSFADKTRVEFTPGVTCIVGPNGCGKSNISDAVRWVLGERSAKMLRGRKMEDIIFAGTTFRKPLNMAEVSLTIDNKEHVLDIGYDEVVLTRRLYRSGDSEYLINKTLCRHKDIQDLIMDTGIGSHSYSMIEQGRIDHILQADPEERRFLIEEAAGISKYKSQKDESIRKLSRTENNLLRLADIVSEVEKNIKYAERQAKRAEKYRESFDILKQKEILKALYETKQLKGRETEVKAQQEELSTRTRQLEARVAALKQSVTELERVEEEKLQELRFKESKRFESKSEIQNRESTKQFNSEKIGEIKNQLETLELEIQTIEQNREGLTQSVGQHQDDARALKETRDQFETIYSEVTSKLTRLEDALNNLVSREKTIHNSAFERASQLSGVRNEIHDIDIERATLETRMKKGEADLKAFKAQLESLRERTTELEEVGQSTGIQYDQAKASFERLNQELESHQTQVRELRAERESALKEHHEIISRLEVLEELNTQYLAQDGISQKDRSEIARYESIKFLIDEISVEPSFKDAVEKSLGSVLRSLILEHPGDISFLAEIIEKREFSRLSILFRGDSASGEMAGILDESLRADLISVESVIKPSPSVVKLVQTLFANTYFLNEDLEMDQFLEIARQNPKLRLISQSGKVYGPGSQLTYLGSSESHISGKFEKDSLVLSREEKEKSLAEKTTSLNDLERQLEEKQIQQLRQADELAGLKHTVEGVKKDGEQSHQQRHELTQNIELLNSEQNQFQSRSQELTGKYQVLTASQSELDAEEKKQQTALNELQSQIQSAKQEVDTAFRGKSEKELERNSLAEKITFHEESAQNIQKQLDEGIQKKERYDQLIVENREKIQQARGQNETLDSELETLRNTLQQDELELHSLEGERVEIQNRKREATEELEGQEKTLEGARAESHKIEMETQEMTHLIKREEERLLQTYKINLSEHSKSDEELNEVDPEALNAEIQALQDKVASVVTKPDTRRSLSAIGSRSAPSSVF